MAAEKIAALSPNERSDDLPATLTQKRTSPHFESNSILQTSRNMRASDRAL